jgi:hypothetical protein
VVGTFLLVFWAGRIAHNLDQPDRLHKTNQAGWALFLLVVEAEVLTRLCQLRKKATDWSNMLAGING